ncbi:hypothetical protein FKW77_010006 [Venturia effusa]|uniref:Uncharacterized protein n=1 Tax=Venturia effusa TaxID=50376 RepID=A0A517L8B3_9PEZI|nr:hypothetical protein FKW77_010006 [Venturia effusa]
MNFFNFSLENHYDEEEDVRYSHSPASTPNLVEKAPFDRVQSMHLSTSDHVTPDDDMDESMRTLDLLDDDDVEDGDEGMEVEKEPEMGAQKTVKRSRELCRTAMELSDAPSSSLEDVTPAIYVSQCFNGADDIPTSTKDDDGSPSSVYSPSHVRPPSSRPQTLQCPHQNQKQHRQLHSLPHSKYEIVAYNNYAVGSTLRPSPATHTPSPLSQSSQPSVEPTTSAAAPATAIISVSTTSAAPERAVSEKQSHHTVSNRSTMNSYRLWPPRKESLPSMLVSTQSLMRYSNEHVPSPPSLPSPYSRHRQSLNAHHHCCSASQQQQCFPACASQHQHSVSQPQHSAITQRSSNYQQLAKKRRSSPLERIDIEESLDGTADHLTFGVQGETMNGRCEDGNESLGGGVKLVRVRIMGRQGSTKNGRVRSQTIIIPASSFPSKPQPSLPAKATISPVRQYSEEGGVEMSRNFSTWDFDDYLLFTELVHSCARLTGLCRYFSARTLRTIRPRRNIENQSECFSEEEMMRCFARPGRGKGRYAWVRWVHLISSYPRLSENGKDGKEEQGDGASAFTTPSHQRLEQVTFDFILGWSPIRIIIALLFIVFLSLLTALLWIFLGTRVGSNGVRVALDASGQPAPARLTPEDTAGYNHAGERVVGGILAGIFALMVGWTGVCGWIVLSWLVE